MYIHIIVLTRKFFILFLQGGENKLAPIYVKSKGDLDIS
jgi:hypothetical protein